MKITPKDWATFQHYKDRDPPWIKLHKKLLNNYEFFSLPVASRALAPCLWLLASEYEGGVIDASLAKLAFRLRMTEGEIAEALQPLIHADFFAVDSGALAPCKQDAMPETEGETQEQTEGEEKEAVADATRPTKERATRLAEDWNPTADDIAFAQQRGWTAAEIETEGIKFRNYWTAKSGKDATKRNWARTWQNWILNSKRTTDAKTSGKGSRDDFRAALGKLREFGESAVGGNDGGPTVRLLPSPGSG